MQFGHHIVLGYFCLHMLSEQEIKLNPQGKRIRQKPGSQNAQAQVLDHFEYIALVITKLIT
jgi:hypothetical protein